MPIYLPSSKFIDPRVIADFYTRAADNAREQRFSPDVFPVIGDLSLGEVMGELKRHTEKGMWHYQNILRFSNFKVISYVETQGINSDDLKSITYVDRRQPDDCVVFAWQSWLREIATDFVQPKVHDQTIDDLVRQDPINGHNWARVNDLSKRRLDLSITETAELNSLEQELDSQKYSQTKAKVLAILTDDKYEQLINSILVPGTDVSFNYVFESIQIQYSDAPALYEKLVDLHDGFEFKDVA
ncbi:hypothetical protein HN587_03375 [Candidatus Woesearchaeota archaeon]|jgi:hypothetical protein|nr:hypothetical protein [Candidatus Woesearchaeota archaeon]